MSSDFEGLFDIRNGNEKDKNFILATFLRGLYYGESFFSQVPKDIFMDKYKHVARALVDAPGVTIKIACLPEDQDVILGYSIVSNDSKTVYWCFVKKAWRERGIAKSLLPKEPEYVAHLTALGESLLCKISNPKLNPFF